MVNGHLFGAWRWVTGEMEYSPLSVDNGTDKPRLYPALRTLTERGIFWVKGNGLKKLSGRENYLSRRGSLFLAMDALQTAGSIDGSLPEPTPEDPSAAPKTRSDSLDHGASLLAGRAPTRAFFDG